MGTGAAHSPDGHWWPARGRTMGQREAEEVARRVVEDGERSRDDAARERHALLDVPARPRVNARYALQPTGTP